MDLNKAVDEAVEFIKSRAPNLPKKEIYDLFVCGEENTFVTLKPELTRYEKNRLNLSPEIKLTKKKENWFHTFEKGDVKKLIERYNFIIPSSSFFWSIHPIVFDFLKENNPIEGFASPFNFNSDLWCSIFEEDKIFGSLGDFFHVIVSRDR